MTDSAAARAGLEVEVVSRHGGVIYDGPATSVVVPLVSGQLGVLPGREPLLALLGDGVVRLSAPDGAERCIEVAGGFCSVDHDTVTVAADRVDAEITERPADVDEGMDDVIDSEDLD